jgi:hypothetical protein
MPRGKKNWRLASSIQGPTDSARRECISNSKIKAITGVSL